MCGSVSMLYRSIFRRSSAFNAWRIISSKSIGFILTHAHADHVAGMDDLRRFVDFRDGDGVPIFGFSEALETVRRMYPYAMRDRPEFRGYPAFIPNLVERNEVIEFSVGYYRNDRSSTRTF